jgi:probable rRNA maturation factor
MDSRFSLSNKTRTSTAGLPLRAVKDRILGPAYELSVALVPAAQARAITKRTKGKDKPSNVLAFPLSRRSGEIVICPATARREAANYGMSPKTFIVFLFIHGCLHLKGMRHGVRMDSTQRSLLARFVR